MRKTTADKVDVAEIAKAIRRMAAVQEWLERLLEDGGAEINGGGLVRSGKWLGCAHVEFIYEGRQYSLSVADEDIDTLDAQH